MTGEELGLTGSMFEAERECPVREKLEALQLDRLRRTLRHALGNPLHRRRLGEVAGDDFRDLQDWSRLPLSTKDELRDAYPWGLVCAPREQCLRVHMSSGTTGNPILNPYTRNDILQWGEVMARCYTAAGVTARDRIQITPSFGLFTGGFGFHYGAERIGAMVIPIGAGRTALQLKLMRDLGASVLAGIATYPLRILEVARAEGLDPREFGWRVAILGSEMWSDDLRRLIERELRLETFDIIGMTETGGPGMGIDCVAHEGIHVWEDHYYCEVIDPETGRLRPDGDEGELVVSTLTREGLPLLRYRTHDLTRVVSRERCACGRTHLRIDRLRGRTDDMVVFKGVNFYPRQRESLILRCPGVSHEYRIVLERPAGGGDRMTLLVEVRPDFDAGEVEGLRLDIKNLLNMTPEVTVLKEGTLERPQGKASRVLDRRLEALPR
jgi:phenylacetate-CoA ligase